MAHTTTTIVLTETARRQAASSDLEGDFLSLQLPGSCQVGDLVSIGDQSAETFRISRRRWLTSKGVAQLEITLDYPVRGAR